MGKYWTPEILLYLYPDTCQTNLARVSRLKEILVSTDICFH